MSAALEFHRVDHESQGEQSLQGTEGGRGSGCKAGIHVSVTGEALKITQEARNHHKRRILKDSVW